MFLACAAKSYSRKTPVEEFTYYVHKIGILSTLNSAIIRLYLMPIKPNNIAEYFAEYFDTEARNIIEISNLRAELCYQKSRAADLKARLCSLERKIDQAARNFQATECPKPTDDQGEKQYEILQRFLRDLQEFHSSQEHLFSLNSAIITKEDEIRCGGEGGEGRFVKTPPPNACFIKAALKKKDSYLEFLDDMRKFDPWGLVFPYIEKERNTTTRKKKNEELFQKKQEREQMAKGLRLPKDLLAKHRDSSENLPADDDSKSIAEMLKQGQLELGRSNDNARAEEFLGEGEEGEAEMPGEDALPGDFYQWDRDYWSQFFKDGDLTQELPPEMKSTQRGKSAGFELQYFNPARFSVDSGGSYSDVRELLEMHAQKYQTKQEPPSIRDSPATLSYRLQNVWTAPKFSYGPLTLPLMYAKVSSVHPPLTPSKPVSDLLKHKISAKTDTSLLDDVIKTDVSIGEPSLRCGKPIRAYSNAIGKQSTIFAGPSRTSTSNSQKRSKNRSGGRMSAFSAAFTSMPNPSHGGVHPKRSVVTTGARVSGVESKGEKLSQGRSAALSAEAYKSRKSTGSVSAKSGKARKFTPEATVTVKTAHTEPTMEIVGVDEKEREDEEVPTFRKKSISIADPEPIQLGQTLNDSSTMQVNGFTQRLSDDPQDMPLEREFSAYRVSGEHVRKSSVLFGSLPSFLSVETMQSMSHKRTVSSFPNTDYRGDPCEPEAVPNFHPYPYLLTEKKPPVLLDQKKGSSRFVQFCKQHYSEDYIQKIQNQFDVTLFDEF